MLTHSKSWKNRKQWTIDKTGPLTDYYKPQMIGYFQSDRVLASKEFLELDASTQKALRAKSKPCYEIISVSPATIYIHSALHSPIIYYESTHLSQYWIRLSGVQKALLSLIRDLLHQYESPLLICFPQQNPSPSVKTPEHYLSTAVAFPATQRTGELKLRSTNPQDPPAINPNFLSHPFDRRLAIESVRETLQFLNIPPLAKDQIRMAAGPAGAGDEEILVHSTPSL